MANYARTNRTAQAFTIESAIGVAGTTWYQLGPNSFGDFGASIKTVARNPISPNNQREAGTIIDVESKASFEGDLTMAHLDAFLAGSMLSTFRGQTQFSPTAVTSTGYTVPSGGAITAGLLIYARGFTTSANNGLKVVGAASTGTEIKTSGLTAESGDAVLNASVEVCGVQGASGDIQINSSGNLISTILDFTTLGLLVGQMIWIGGTAGGSTAFATAANRGFARITAIAAGTLTLDKRTAAYSTDNGSSKTIQLLYGRVIRIVPVTHADYAEPTYTFEVTYPTISSGNDVYEYPAGNAVSEFTLTMPKTEKITMSVAFMGTDTAVPSTSRDTGASAALPQTMTTAVNTVSDMMRGRIQTSAQAALSGYITSANLKIKTNATRNTAHGTLGSILTTFGIVEVDVDVNAFFTDTAMVSSVRNNTTVTADWCMRNNDGAICFDVPECKLSNGKREFPLNEVVHIALGVGAFRDSVYNTSLIVSRLPYCPAS